MSKLEQFMRDGVLRSFCQPIFELGGLHLNVYGIECLTRGPEGSPFENPEILFDYARRLFAEAELDLWSANMNLRACAGLSSRGLSRLRRIALNVHASSLAKDRDFGQRILEAAARNGIDSHRIVIEIVEQARDRDKASLARSLSVLRDAGAEISLDDFGTEHSNFRRLLDIRPSAVKLDRSLVRGIDSDKYKRAIAASLVRMAEDLDITLIAEGVETKAELSWVREMGIQIVQGYLFTRPFRTIEFHRKYEEIERALRPSFASSLSWRDIMIASPGGNA